jgi:hypothetical protein
LGIWQTPSGRSRRWVKRKDTNIPAPLYARLTILALLVVLVATLAWYGGRSLWQRVSRSEPAPVAQAPSMPRSSGTASWERDVLASIESGIHSAQGGNITAAEVAVDRAGSMIEAARVDSNGASPDFFDTASRSLDRALQTHPDNSRLFEHVTAARVNLAQLRSTRAGSPSTAADAAGTAATASQSEKPAGDEQERAFTPGGSQKTVTLSAPREIAANRLLNPEALGGDTIDATLMPETVEILLPPSTRLFLDNVRVQDFTIKGASQTIDGIHWKNITFIGTRLRYESGELDLQNVHFLNCTFGVPMDQRGARLANAIALGQASLTIVE